MCQKLVLETWLLEFTRLPTLHLLVSPVRNDCDPCQVFQATLRSLGLLTTALFSPFPFFALSPCGGTVEGISCAGYGVDGALSVCQ